MHVCGIMQFYVGFGINSFSWDNRGTHLLVTSNNMSHVVVVTRKKSSVKSHSSTLRLPYIKQTDKVNFVGVFHPTKDDLFVGSSSGFISVI